jgi:hypothetical protein
MFRAPFPAPRARLTLVLALLALLCLAPLALGGAPSAAAKAPAKAKAKAASSFSTGIGDEQHEMFTDPLYLQLHTKIARYIAPYDAAIRPDDLAKATAWIQAAEADGVQVLVAFYHSEHTPTKLPSVASYQSDVQKFIKLFPNVTQYQSWDEANRGTIRNQLASPTASTAAKYYQALKRVCPHTCTVIGLDVLDQATIKPTLRYIREFKHEISRLQTVMPKIWGLHNYSDVNRLESWRTRDLLKALGGQVWLTETGGIVQFAPIFLNRNGAGLTRAAKVVKFVFSLAAAHHQITRLYLYDWTGGTTSTRFDAGLTNAQGQPRPAYQALCRQLHAAECNVQLATN